VNEAKQLKLYPGLVASYITLGQETRWAPEPSIEWRKMSCARRRRLLTGTCIRCDFVAAWRRFPALAVRSTRPHARACAAAAHNDVYRAPVGSNRRAPPALAANASPLTDAAEFLFPSEGFARRRGSGISVISMSGAVHAAACRDKVRAARSDLWRRCGSSALAEFDAWVSILTPTDLLHDIRNILYNSTGSALHR